MLHAVEPINERVGVEMVEERRSGWSDPRVVVSVAGVFVSLCGIAISFLGLCVLVLGGLIGIYVVSQTNDVTSELSTGQIAEEIRQVNLTVEKLDGKVTTAMGALQSTQGRVDSVARDIEQLRETDKDAEERMKTLERDYTSNFTARLAKVEATIGKGN